MVTLRSGDAFNVGTAGPAARRPSEPTPSAHPHFRPPRADRLAWRGSTGLARIDWALLVRV
jgi:hypothetical protein